MRLRLMLLLCAVLTPIALAGVYNEFRVRHERIDEVHADALRAAHLVHSDVVNIVQGTHNLLAALATIPAIASLDRGQCTERLAELRARFDRYLSIVLTDWQGRVVCSSGVQLPLGQTLDRPYLTAARERDDLAIGEFARTDGTRLPALPMAYPFRAASGQGAGILVATLDLQWLSRHLSQIPDIGNAVIAIADRNGVFLARNLDADRFVGTPFVPGAMGPVHASAPGTGEVEGADGVTRIIGYLPAAMPPDGLYVGIGIDRTLAMRPVDIETAAESSFIVAALIVALITGWVGAGRFGRLQQAIEARTAELEAEKQYRSEIEATLVRSQKLEAVGQLTAGLAHDFNNLLAVVLGNIELARRRLRGNPETDRLLARSAAAAERGSGLTQQLLAFARDQVLAIEPIDANRLIREAQELLARSVGPTVRIRLDLAPDTAAVLVDRSQLEVALLNLALNARDAMPAGGTITITTCNTTAALLPADLAAGDYVLIRVADTGFGMSAEVKARAFDPFYTTKEIGKGSGLGLAQVFGIARQSGGTVVLESVEGRGTAVTLFLPHASTSVAPGEPAVDNAPPARSDALRLLLVDDDPAVRSTLVMMLESLGHSVHDCDSGRAALDELERSREYDVLVSDLAMPVMDGAELADRATALAPGLKVLLVTGFGGHDRELAWPILRKPFKSEDMAAALGTLTQRLVARGAGR